MDYYEVIFDIETQNFFDDTGSGDPSKLRVSIVSLYRRKLNADFTEISGEMMSFWENRFPDMWKIFREADRIIGFNTINFDIPVLKSYAPADFSKLPHFDIYQKIKELNDGRAASLNRITKETLGNVKIDDPVNAIIYWRKHDPESLKLLQSYCEGDVMLTRDLYDFGLKNKFIKYIDKWNNPRTIPVDFSYPQESKPPPQPSLF